MKQFHKKKNVASHFSVIQYMTSLMDLITLKY